MNWSSNSDSFIPDAQAKTVQELDGWKSGNKKEKIENGKERKWAREEKYKSECKEKRVFLDLDVWCDALVR